MKNITAKVLLSATFVTVIIPQNAYGMHIAEGFLSPQWCMVWYGAILPVLFWGTYAIKKQTANNHKVKILLGVAGAFTFLLSALKIPSVTGSCSHMTGTGLGAILFGPATMSVLALIVLLFQTLLLAHGGLTTLGANTFSMGIAGPFLSWGIFKLMQRLKVNNSVAVFTATFTGSLFTYGVTAFQLALAFPGTNGSIAESLIKFGSVFCITQIPLSVIEGLISVLVFNFIQAHNREELMSLNVYGGSKQ
jgi:cobalt/nickel transport system permease protein